MLSCISRILGREQKEGGAGKTQQLAGSSVNNLGDASGSFVTEQVFKTHFLKSGEKQNK